MIFGESARQVRRVEGPRDRYGDITYIDAELGAINGVSLQSATTSEPYEANRNLVTLQAVLYVPAGTDVQPSDKLIVRGTTYEVTGQPIGEINSFTGTAGMIPVPIKVVTG